MMTTTYRGVYGPFSAVPYMHAHELEDLAARVARGEFTAVVAPNGAVADSVQVVGLVPTDDTSLVEAATDEDAMLAVERADDSLQDLLNVLEETEEDFLEGGEMAEADIRFAFARLGDFAGDIRTALNQARGA